MKSLVAPRCRTAVMLSGHLDKLDLGKTPKRMRPTVCSITHTTQVAASYFS